MNIPIQLHGADRRFGTLPLRTRMAHEADLEVERMLNPMVPPGTELNLDHYSRLLEYRRWKIRLLAFPNGEKDRYGEEIYETSKDLVSRLFKDLESADVTVAHQLYSIFLAVPFVSAVGPTFGLYPPYQPALGVLTRSYLEQRHAWEKELEESDVKEQYLKVARERIFVWGKKE